MNRLEARREGLPSMGVFLFRRDEAMLEASQRNQLAVRFLGKRGLAYQPLSIKDSFHSKS